MEHLTIYFKHGIKDVIPYSDFIASIRLIIEEKNLGEYLEDDMAIDGGDAEVVFSCQNAESLFEFIKTDLTKLACMKGAKVTFVFGELDSNAPIQQFYL